MRAAAFRIRVFSFENAISIGLRSGLYGGKGRNHAPLQGAIIVSTDRTAIQTNIADGARDMQIAVLDTVVLRPDGFLP